MLPPAPHLHPARTLQRLRQPNGGRLTPYPLHHQIQIGQAAPGVVVHAVQQQIAHGTADHRQPTIAGAAHQHLDQQRRHPW